MRKITVEQLQELLHPFAIPLGSSWQQVADKINAFFNPSPVRDTLLSSMDWEDRDDFPDF